jgi:hypothetical protein
MAAERQGRQQENGELQPWGTPPPARHAPAAARRPELTAAAQFWYVLMNICLAAGYFAKIPAKKALSDFGMAQMTGAEKFWYALMCVSFGAGYFAKIPVAKALTEMRPQQDAYR